MLNSATPHPTGPILASVDTVICHQLTSTLGDIIQGAEKTRKSPSPLAPTSGKLGFGGDGPANLLVSEALDGQSLLTRLSPNDITCVPTGKLATPLAKSHGAEEAIRPGFRGSDAGDRATAT